jgi:FtsH-binding integral membrane protein
LFIATIQSSSDSTSPPPIYAVAGLVIFGAFTIFDFNRLRRSTPDNAVPIAVGIFLDVFNVFLLILDLFGGRRD